MAKKSTATRQGNAARRSQTTDKRSAVALVRTPKETNETTGTSQSHASTPTRSAITSNAERPRSPAVTNKTTTRPAPRQEPVARPENTRAQASRVARARATQRARTAHQISPEHYGYVINDLKLIAALAVTMFAVIIVLHFVLPQ